jgi:hypothetical protein
MKKWGVHTKFWIEYLNRGDNVIAPLSNPIPDSPLLAKIGKTLQMFTQDHNWPLGQRHEKLMVILKLILKE